MCSLRTADAFPVVRSDDRKYVCCSQANTCVPGVNFRIKREKGLIACSKRSDSGERCGVEKAMKSRGGLGREVRFPLSPLLLPRFYFFALPFTLHRSPLSERLEQATGLITPADLRMSFFCCVKGKGPGGGGMGEESRSYGLVEV